MMNTGAKHRCPKCGKIGTIDYICRLHPCQHCGSIFYYNRNEPYPFPRLPQLTAEELQARQREEQHCIEAYRRVSGVYEEQAERLNSSLERVFTTGRVLMLALIIQVITAFQITGSASLQDFSRVEVIIIAILFFISLVLVTQQFSKGAELKQQRFEHLRRLSEAQELVTSLQKQLDLSITGSSAYVEGR